MSFKTWREKVYIQNVSSRAKYFWKKVVVGSCEEGLAALLAFLWRPDCSSCYYYRGQEAPRLPCLGLPQLTCACSGIVGLWFLFPAQLWAQLSLVPPAPWHMLHTSEQLDSFLSLSFWVFADENSYMHGFLKSSLLLFLLIFDLDSWQPMYREMSYNPYSSGEMENFLENYFGDY